MYQRILLVCLLLMASPLSRAADIFYGIAIINQEVDVSITDAANTTTVSDDGTGIGVFADTYYKGIYRFNGTVSYVDYTDFYITSVTASADYLIPINATFTFFAGVSAGVTGQVYSDSSISDITWPGPN